MGEDILKVDEKLLEKIAQSRKEVSEMRGIIITKSVDIDGFIGAIITNYFVIPKMHSNFSLFVSSNPYFSFGLKIDILKKIINELKFEYYANFKDDLTRVNELRNRFAHSIQFGFEGDLAYSAGEKSIKIKKAKEMYDEFMGLYPKVKNELEKILQHIIKEKEND